MAAFSSKATGNWDAESETTWNEAGHPTAGDTVVIQNGHTVTLDSATACGTLTIDSGGVLTDATNNVGITVSGITAVTGTMTLGTAACSFGSGVTVEYSLEVSAGGTVTGGSGDWTVGSLQCQTATSTLTMTSGTCTIDSCRDTAYGLIVIADATFNHNNGTITFTGISADMHVDALAHSLYNLIINSGNTHRLRKDIIIENDLTITSGTFSTGTSNYALTVTGNLSNAGTFVPNASLVTLNGTGQSLTGSWTFWHFTKSVAAADTLTFDNTGTYTFGGNVTLNGAVGELLSLVSDSAGNAFSFIMLAGAVKTSLDYLSIKDSDASGTVSALKPIAPTNSTEVSGNTDWSGSAYVIPAGMKTILNYYY